MNDRTGPVKIDEITIPVEGEPEKPPASAPDSPKVDAASQGWGTPEPPASFEEGAQGRVFPGVYPAVVVDHGHPAPPTHGQLRIRLPWLSQDEPVELWARYMGPVGGPGAGAWFLPEVDDEVLVAFEAGDLRRPYVLGGLWNGPDPAPEEPRQGGEGQPWSITTRGGSRIVLEDGAGGPRISVETPAGGTLVLDDAAGGSVVVRDPQGCEIRMEGGNVHLSAPGRVVVQSTLVDVEAGMVEVNASMTRFKGVVMCDTLISSAVVSASYTPGTGNIW